MLEIKSRKQFFETDLNTVALKTDIRLKSGECLEYALNQINAYTLEFLSERCYYPEFENAYNELIRFIKQFSNSEFYFDVDGTPKSEHERTLKILHNLKYIIQ